MNEHPQFGPEVRACAALAAGAPQGPARAALFERIDRAIEPFDTAGLLDRTRRDWYPVLADDLVSSAGEARGVGRRRAAVVGAVRVGELLTGATEEDGDGGDEGHGFDTKARSARRRTKGCHSCVDQQTGRVAGRKAGEWHRTRGGHTQSTI